MAKKSPDDMVYLSFTVKVDCTLEESVADLAKRLNMTQTDVRSMVESCTLEPSPEQRAALREGADEDSEEFELDEASIEPDDQSD